MRPTASEGGKVMLTHDDGTSVPFAERRKGTRIKTSDIQKGKSAGYRVIYYLQTQTGVVLVTIYSKSDLSDVSDRVIEQAIRQYEK